jgi:hypothetical protein
VAQSEISIINCITIAIYSAVFSSIKKAEKEAGIDPLSLKQYFSMTIIDILKSKFV